MFSQCSISFIINDEGFFLLFFLFKVGFLDSFGGFKGLLLGCFDFLSIFSLLVFLNLFVSYNGKLLLDDELDIAIKFFNSHVKGDSQIFIV